MGIFSWFKDRKKNKTLKSYVYGLGPLLAKQYGKAKTYSPDQIKDLVEKYKLNEDFLSYAMVMYLDKGRFGDVKKEMEADWNYESLRKEVADKFFGGNMKFTGLDVKNSSQAVANTIGPLALGSAYHMPGLAVGGGHDVGGGDGGGCGDGGSGGGDGS